MKIKVKFVAIQVGKDTIHLAPQDAMSLREQLNLLFGPHETIIYPAYQQEPQQPQQPDNNLPWHHGPCVTFSTN